jgi:hypothetical protein
VILPPNMRVLCAACLCLTVGCATTVTRLDGEVKTGAGPARSACEQESWLVIAPTRTEIVEPGHKTPTPRNDGLGLYRVGSRSPESIPALADDLDRDPMVLTHEARVRDHDDRRVLAAGLGAAGIIALGIGTALFISSFETETVTGANGIGEEKQNINSGRAVAGGLVFAGGFGLGIAGIVVNPSQAQRSEADAWRSVFMPPDDSPEEVKRLIQTHNEGVRKRCAGSSSAAAE